ncbi:MAG: hypothetical protein QNJ62_06365 [Methyloceanibacter sp.]|nr:hypothetical protein [Methyloceanibacter sp.]
MLTHTALFRTLPLAALIVAASFCLSIETADAQNGARSERSGGILKRPHRGPAIGGTSWTLSDVWGVPEMPEQPIEAPGFDFGAGGFELNGPPNQSPYPN